MKRRVQKLLNLALLTQTIYFYEYFVLRIALNQNNLGLKT